LRKRREALRRRLRQLRSLQKAVPVNALKGFNHSAKYKWACNSATLPIPLSVECDRKRQAPGLAE